MFGGGIFVVVVVKKIPFSGERDRRCIRAQLCGAGGGRGPGWRDGGAKARWPCCLHPLCWDQSRARLSPKRCVEASTEPNPDFTQIHGNFAGGTGKFSALAIKKKETLPRYRADAAPQGPAAAAPALQQAPPLGTSAPSFAQSQPAPGATAAGRS